MAEADARLEALVARLVAGDRAALARCVTLVEGGEHANAARRLISPLAGRARILGFTGAPGVGKSTLIDAYIARLRGLGQTVAVAAVDPSSPISGGAVLGDRVRMGRHSADPGVFIRSIAARTHLGGLSESIHWTIDAMDAAGWDVVIIETVGTGQSEVEVAEIADVCVVVNAPGLGDDVQAIKAGVLEIADVLVVNKADSPLAELTVRQLRGMLELRAQTRKDVPIVLTTATENRGVADLHAVIASLVQRTPEEKRSARRRRARLLIAQTAAGLARRWVLAQSDVRFDALVEAVSSGETQLEEAAARALRWME